MALVKIGQDELRARIAARIRQLAQRRGLRLSHLADQASVSRTHLWEVLGGRRAATSDVLAKLAAVLGVDPLELLRTPQKPRAPK